MGPVFETVLEIGHSKSGSTSRPRHGRPQPSPICNFAMATYSPFRLRNKGAKMKKRGNLGI
jgi:hypothetical protein